MERAIEKASSLIEAMEYIRRFRGCIVVVKLGGSVLDEPELERKLLTDVAFMATVGIRPVIVHGGGKAITEAMNKAGLEPQWVQGRRYTDKRVLAIAEHTLINKVNSGICGILNESGCMAMGLHSLSSCVLCAEQLKLTGENGRNVDIGLVGQVRDINSELLNTLCSAAKIPVIAPIGLDRGGGKFNVNADSAAGMVAAAVKAEKLVMVSDTHGILTDLEDPASRVSSADEATVKRMIADGIISGAMLPKVEACISALDGGVKKAHIIDGRIEHSLLLEIYTSEGIGTELLIPDDNK